jgi:hypothetical protein
MQLTPTDKGAGLAGLVLASLGWLSLFKLDSLAELCHVNRWIKQEKIFGWITQSMKTKSTALLITEIINFGVHGISSPAGVLFACGSTVINAFMIFVGLPLRMKAKREVVIA